MSIRTRLNRLEQKLARPIVATITVAIREIVVHDRAEALALRQAGILDDAPKALPQGDDAPLIIRVSAELASDALARRKS